VGIKNFIKNLVVVQMSHPSQRVWFQVFFVLAVIGALNWGLVAIDPQNDLILYTFPSSKAIRSILYAIIGLSGIVACYLWLSFPNQVCRV